MNKEDFIEFARAAAAFFMGAVILLVLVGALIVGFQLLFPDTPAAQKPVCVKQHDVPNGYNDGKITICDEYRMPNQQEAK